MYKALCKVPEGEFKEWLKRIPDLKELTVP